MLTRNQESKETSIGCELCRGARRPDVDMEFSFAFQPIIDLSSGKIYAQEVLLRSLDGDAPHSVLNLVPEHDRHVFDQAVLLRGVELSGKLDVPHPISLNVRPNAMPQIHVCLPLIFREVRTAMPSIKRLILEITETEPSDPETLREIVRVCKSNNVRIAIDDFGAGHSGLGRLAEIQPDILKLDMSLIRNIDQDVPRQHILDGIISTTTALEIDVIAEGVETIAERDQLLQQGVRLFQGYLFAKPAFQTILREDDLEFLRPFK